MLAGTALAQPIRIGVSGPLTGRLTSTGVAMLNGARIAVAEINAAGGAMGRPLELVERDDAGDVALGQAAARQLIGVEHVIATIGFGDTDVALASGQFYEDASVPVLTAAATGDAITHQFQAPEYKANYIFRVGITDAIQAAAIVKEAIETRHLGAPALLTETTAQGQAFRALLRAALDAARITPAADETFPIRATDMTTQLSRAKQASAGVILAYGQGPELRAIANSMGELGWKLPILGNADLATAAFLTGAGENGDGASMPMTVLQTGDTPKRASFFAAYARTYRVARIPAPEVAAQAYDSVWLLKAAIEQAASTDGPKVRAALENSRTPFTGVVTIYDRPFSVSDHEAISANIPVFGVVRNQGVVAAHEEDLSGERAVRTRR
jgi:branched-chain amino acid transport system substrate-binding protein